MTDAAEGTTLPGANVFIQGTSLGAATGVEGEYQVRSIPAGDYVLRASYVGYENREIPISIVDGQTVTLDIELSPSGVLGEVVVSGQLEGQRAAINQQLSSNTIVNVVSEAKIQELPDANAAESIGRLPGVSVQRSGGEASQITLRGLSGAFTNVTVDGVKLSPTDAASRSVDLSTISQGSLSHWRWMSMRAALEMPRMGAPSVASAALSTRARSSSPTRRSDRSTSPRWRTHSPAR